MATSASACDRDCPAPKSKKLAYKLCGHCNREVNEKIFKEHRRLYYDPTTKIWTRESEVTQDDHDDASLSSELESLDDLDLEDTVLPRLKHHSVTVTGAGKIL